MQQLLQIPSRKYHSLGKSKQQKRVSCQAKEAAIEMLERILNQLMGTLIDSGVTAYEACQVTRRVAVRVAASKAAQLGSRESKSQVAAMTGLPRPVVTRLLKPEAAVQASRQHLHPIQRLIDAWLDTPGYLLDSGEPRHIPIYGKRPSFESLARMHCSGIPVRAVVDEMQRLKAIEVVRGENIRLQSRLFVSSGLSANSVRLVGVRAADLIGTLTTNLYSKQMPLLETAVSVSGISSQYVPLIKREISKRTSSFVASMNSLLQSSKSPRNRSKSDPTTPDCIGVGIYYFERLSLQNTHQIERSPRPNYKRQQRNPGAHKKQAG